MNREQYHERYRTSLRNLGVPQVDVDRIVKEMQRTDALLDSCTCPVCSGNMVRLLDSRQAGERPEGTTWFNYRCQGCNFICDRAE